MEPASVDHDEVLDSYLPYIANKLEIIHHLIEDLRLHQYEELHLNMQLDIVFLVAQVVENEVNYTGRG